MKKALMITAVLTATPLVAGLYGVLHDQLTYTVAPEYYTCFKFPQFGLSPELVAIPRLGAAAVGFLATWWIGIPIGLGLAVVLLFHPAGAILRAYLKGMLVLICTALAFGLAGLMLGFLFFARMADNWLLPEGVTQAGRFIAVGCMHNGSYLGGLVGLILAILHLVRNRKVAISTITVSK